MANPQQNHFDVHWTKPDDRAAVYYTIRKNIPNLTSDNFRSINPLPTISNGRAMRKILTSQAEPTLSRIYLTSGFGTMPHVARNSVLAVRTANDM